MEPQFPKELTDKFLIGRFVSGGSYGNVNMVKKKSDNKIYAMKTVARNHDGSSWKNIETEMQVLSFVNPYKLHLDCFFMDGNTVYMIVDWCPKHLAKYITDMEPGGFEEKEIWRLFIQICFGLESLHYNEFIHRDLHLQNILLDENNNIKIADFGISRYMQTSKIDGADAIRSPRGCRGRKEDIQTKESDIWAVGYTLYYLCTLQDPFNEDPNRIQHEPHRDIREFNSKYSEQLKNFVDWCLKKDRSERPTIIQILTDKFIVDKTRSLEITIPQTSIMKTISLQTELSAYESGEVGALNLQLKSELAECCNEIVNQNSEIQQLKAEVASLKNIIAAKGNDIETFRLKAVGISKIIEKEKSLNKKQLVEVKNSIRDLIADAEKSKKMLDYPEQDLNKKINENLLLTPQVLAKKRAILSKGNNKITEQSFREFCLLYERECPDSNLPLSQDFQEYINFYHQITSLYLTKNGSNRTKLIIYDTESEREEERILDVPELLDSGTCIAQLPNDELFCYGNWSVSGITLIIDRSYGVNILPSGIPCSSSSGIYLNDNVYCFGGQYKNRTDLTLSSKFDLNGNRWINNLNPMPQPDLFCCCVIFNGNILISGYKNRNIWRYSVDSDAFSTIPYQFAASDRKILINVERLYLIECDGFIYESEAGDDCAWKQISKSVIGSNSSAQVYCSYNKGGIYIATYCSSNKYYKFDLSQKIMTKLQ